MGSIGGEDVKRVKKGVVRPIEGIGEAEKVGG